MEYFIIGIIVVIATAVGVLIYRTRKQQSITSENAVITKQKTNTASSEQVYETMNQLMIQLEQLPAESINENKLMKITDSKLLTRVNNLVPELFQAGNAAVNAVQAARANGQVLYKAIIPAGAKLADSKDMAGAVRGYYHGTKGVKGQANLVNVKQNANVAGKVASSAINVASLVVGQYYMSQIDVELGKINTRITKIADFQDNEYKSKVFALVAQIQKMVKFQIDILDNDELRLSEIDNINRWEQECIQLLGQANLTLAGFAKKKDHNYAEYEKELAEAQNWFVYQETLMQVLTNIAELKHTLHLGAVTREQCFALLPTYAKQVQSTLEQLSRWHQTQVEKLKINVNENTRKRMGLNGVIYYIPGLINEEKKFRSVSNTTVKKIVDQSNGYEVPQNFDVIDLFQEDVKMISKGGELYYLPQDTV